MRARTSVRRAGLRSDAEVGGRRGWSWPLVSRLPGELEHRVHESLALRAFGRLCRHPVSRLHRPSAAHRGRFSGGLPDHGHRTPRPASQTILFRRDAARHRCDTQRPEGVRRGCLCRRQVWLPCRDGRPCFATLLDTGTHHRLGYRRRSMRGCTVCAEGSWRKGPKPVYSVLVLCSSAWRPRAGASGSCRRGGDPPHERRPRRPSTEKACRPVRDQQACTGEKQNALLIDCERTCAGRS
jgi:hypothetical protein